MSWKIRRAHYYSRQKGGGIDAEGAKWFNLIFLISLAFSLILLVLANGGADADNPVVLILSAFGFLSLITTPILFLFFLGNIQHGLPNLSKSPKKERDFHQENLNNWLEENKEKKIFNREAAEKKAKAYHRKRQNKQK